MFLHPLPSIQYYRVHETWSTLRKQISRCINVGFKNELRFSEVRRCSKTVSWKIRKAAGCSFIKQGFWHRYFLVNFPKFFKTATIQKIRETLLHFFRSSHPEVFCKIGFLRNFTKFTGKHLGQSLLFIKVATSAYNFIRKRLWRRRFLWILQNF